jgi:hypothetical protein
MRRRDYLKTIEGQFSRYRTRAQRRLHFIWHDEPVSKNGPSDSKLQFQSLLLQHLDHQGRRAFTGPVMVKLRFASSQRNAPELHTLAKNYLDLLQAPMEQLKTRRKKLMLSDDAQVAMLVVEHSPHDSPPHVIVEAAPISDVVADVELFFRMAHGEWATGSRNQRAHDVEHPFDIATPNAIHELLRVRRILENASLPDMDRRQQQLIEKLLIPAAQTQMLNIGRVTEQHIFSVLLPRISRLGPGRVEMKATLDSMARAYWDNTLAIALGGHPTQSGESKTYRTNVDRAIASFKERHPILFPLRVPVSVNILNVQPTNVRIDLDNLARKVIGPIRQAYKPPTTMLHGLDADQASDPSIRTLIDSLPQSARSLVTKYEVYACPRLSTDPPAGLARVGLAPATAPVAIDTITDQLSDWCKKVL